MIIDTLVQKAVTLVPHSIRGTVKSLPVIGAAQRYLVNQRLAGKSFIHTVDAGPSRGITYELTLPEDKGIWTGNYEPNFAARLALEMRPGMVGYDIGAWHGYFTGIMLASGASEVILFEPLPENQARLERLKDLNNGHVMVIEPVALADREGTAKLTRIETSSMAKLSDSPFEPDDRPSNEISVSLTTIDAMVARGDIPPPDIIKIDVEGAEAMVLKGAEHTLSAAKPIVLAEIHSSSLLQEVNAFMTSRGYVVEEIDASGLRREVGAGHICARPAT